MYHTARLLEALKYDVWDCDSSTCLFQTQQMHAWLRKSTQWLLLPLILHEHVTLFWRPLCFRSIPLHLFIFFSSIFHFAFFQQEWEFCEHEYAEVQWYFFDGTIALWFWCFASWNYVLLSVSIVMKNMQESKKTTTNSYCLMIIGLWL